MALIQKRREENEPGVFYVDTTCIDCDTCRWMAPEVFGRVGEMSAVTRQPGTEAERVRAAQALIACPTSSIGTERPLAEVKAAAVSFPRPVAEDVHHCGYHSEKSFGGASYLIVREGGNVLVDSPRFARPLVKRLEAMGGVRTMLLSHIDDVADHELFARHFGCERVMHAQDAVGLAGIERRVTGRETAALDEELLMIPVPGHTEGSMVFLYREAFLFSGDHLAFSRTLGHLHAFKSACWYSWEELRRSMRRLADLRFRHVLPGHGTPWSGTEAEAGEQMRKCLAWMDAGETDGEDW